MLDIMYLHILTSEDILTSCKHIHAMNTPEYPTFILVKMKFTGVNIVLMFASSRRFQHVPAINVLGKNITNIIFVQ